MAFGLEMELSVEKEILQVTQATRINKSELIQGLWSGYGQLLRLSLEGGLYPSVILKHVCLPEEVHHPRGMSSTLSHQRKIQSYEVECHWYESYNDQFAESEISRTAKKIASYQKESEFFLLLEDLKLSGYRNGVEDLNFEQSKLVLSWLASFHARNMHCDGKGLWPSGTYWHLQTRPQELDVLEKEDKELWRVASFIDRSLATSKYKTLVHGDAKLANFLFCDQMERVAAVDFQYVGVGCGMKDVAYFVGSCFNEEQSEKFENEMLDFYFSQLRKELVLQNFDLDELESDWRSLYHVAWSDFHRFLKGWSPGHWKINSYSERICRQVIEHYEKSLLDTAKKACVEAGEILKSSFQKDMIVSSKPGHTESAQVVTEVDLRSEEKIRAVLSESINRFDIGYLGEESVDRGDRHEKDFFWAVDPMDGTLRYSQGLSGYAVSIALVKKDGSPFLGVVYDPVTKSCYHSVVGRGAFENDLPMAVMSKKDSLTKIKLFADPSLKSSESFELIAEVFDVQFEGGSVMNCINVIKQSPSCYFKFPKKEKGGCAIWDLAAVSILLGEAGGTITAFSGAKLEFNSTESVYFNKLGLMVCSNQRVLERVKNHLSSIVPGFPRKYS